MTMIDIAPHWGPPDKTRTVATAGSSFTERWVMSVNRRDDDCLAALGIFCPKPKPTLPPAAAAKVAPKVDTVDDKPVPCLVPSNTLKRGDKVEILTGKFSTVGRVVGTAVFLDGGWSFTTYKLPTVMLVYRATAEESEEVRIPKPNRPEYFRKSAPTLESALKVAINGKTDPDCPSAPPYPTEPVPGGAPEPKPLPSNVTLFMPGEVVPMNPEPAGEPKPNRFKVMSYEEMKEKAGPEAAERWAAMNAEVAKTLAGVVRS